MWPIEIVCILLHVQFTALVFCYMMYSLRILRFVTWCTVYERRTLYLLHVQFTNFCYMYSLRTLYFYMLYSLRTLRFVPWCTVYELCICYMCSLRTLYFVIYVQFTNFCYMYSLRTCVVFTVYELYVLLHNVQFTIILMFYNSSKFDRLKIVGLYKGRLYHIVNTFVITASCLLLI